MVGVVGESFGEGEGLRVQLAPGVDQQRVAGPAGAQVDRRGVPAQPRSERHQRPFEGVAEGVAVADG